MEDGHAVLVLLEDFQHLLRRYTLAVYQLAQSCVLSLAQCIAQLGRLLTKVAQIMAGLLPIIGKRQEDNGF